MKSIAGRMLILTALAMLVAQCALAAPSSLNLMPTADVLGHGEFAIEYENDAEPLLSSECDQYVLIQVGLLDRLELGVDRCFHGAKATYWNFKLLVREEDESGPAIAVGVQNIVEGDDNQPYLALAKEVRGARLHLGAIRLYEETEAMAGVEYWLSDRVTLAADHMTGVNGATTLGGWVALNDSWYLSLARVMSPTEDWDDYWQAVLSYYGAGAF